MARANQASQIENSIYSVLLAVAVVALAVGVGVVWWQNVQLTAEQQPPGFKNPFYLVEAPPGG